MKKIGKIKSLSAFQKLMQRSSRKKSCSPFYVFSVIVFSLLTQPLIVWSSDESSSLSSSENSVAPAPNREQIIQKEFDCIRQKKDKVIEWSDVCYATVGAQARADLINNTLETMEQNFEEEEPQAEDLPYESYSLDHQESYGPLIDEQMQDPEFQPNPEYMDDQEQQEYQEEIQPELATSPIPLKLLYKKHSFQLGSEGFAYHYKEPDIGVDIQGIMYGFYGLYEFRPDKDEQVIQDVINMYKLDARFAYGQLDYSSASGKLDDIDNYSIEFRAAAGYDFFPVEQTRITPYGGFGYRFLYAGGGGRRTDLGLYNYDRSSHYLYAPLGFDFLTQLTSHWQFGFNAQGDIFIWGRQDSYLSDVSTSYGDLKNRQRRGFGLRGSIKLVHKGDRIDFHIEPFVRYWHIKNSDVSRTISPTGVVTTGLEPNNNTSEIGVKLGIQY